MAAEPARHECKRHGESHDVQHAQSVEPGNAPDAAADQDTDETSSQSTDGANAAGGGEQHDRMGEEHRRVIHGDLRRVSADETANDSPLAQREHQTATHPEPASTLDHDVSAEQHGRDQEHAECGIVEKFDTNNFQATKMYSVGLGPNDIAVLYGDQFVVTSNYEGQSISKSDTVAGTVQTTPAPGKMSGVSIVF